MGYLLHVYELYEDSYQKTSHTPPLPNFTEFVEKLLQQFTTSDLIRELDRRKVEREKVGHKHIPKSIRINHKC